MQIQSANDAERLAIRPREAAKALGMSERKLWQLTKEGRIPHKREGRLILFAVEELREWLKSPPRRAQEGTNQHRKGGLAQ